MRAIWLLLALATPVFADPPHGGDWIAHDFTFHTGEVMDVRLHYTTLGDPKNPAVLVLHGTGGSGDDLLDAAFGGELFAAGAPLDATKYFIVLPDAIGHGGSSKPSNGLRTKFPKYDYDDLVDAQHRLVTEGLGITHLRLVIGISMGGMNTWLWGERYPDFVDALVPLASQPTAMASRNWMLRRLVIEAIENDPGYHAGNYSTQPAAVKYAQALYDVATNGGTLRVQAKAPTRELADKLVERVLAEPVTDDANDVIWALDASRSYDPEPQLAKIRAAVLAINSADDERDPPETGVMVRAMKQVKRGRVYLIPATSETSGHGTVFRAKFYAAQLRAFLAALKR